jgi:uncharacterized protein (DUF697 family)
MVSPVGLKRPLLVGGLGLTASLWLLNTLQTSVDGSLITSTLVLGAGIWWWRHQRPQSVSQSSATPAIAPVQRQAVVDFLDGLTPLLEQIQAGGAGNAADPSVPKPSQVEATQIKATQTKATQTKATQTKALQTDHFRALTQRREDLRAELDRATLRLGVVGAPGTGKTTLAQSLRHLGAAPGTASPAETLAWATPITVAEYPRPAQGEDSGDEDWAAAIADRDALIYLVGEDLTASVQQDLRTLVGAGHTVALVLNKQDHYPPDDRAVVLANLRHHAQALTPAVTVGAIAAAPKAIKVRTHQADGTVGERLDTPAPVLGDVVEQVQRWITQQTVLVPQTVQRQGHLLRRDIQRRLNQQRRDRARPLVEQLQWTAAATALASPLPSLDLLATVAINAQLVMDLGRAYDQPFSLEQAKEAAGELAGLVVKLGVVEASTQVLSAALKTHAATYVVGGIVQGLSAAYLTRMVADSLMTDLEERALRGETATPLSPQAIAQGIQRRLALGPQAESMAHWVQRGLQQLQGVGRGPTPVGSGSTVGEPS